ncbi:MAG: Abi family protein [Bacteroidaceae bacterium]|nr:Abi family protein [Bacteroidaceae bacterium]
MKYVDFERFFSQKRVSRYVQACGSDTRKAMTLYRYNLRLAQEIFTIISCFEVSLRNAIDEKLVPILGSEWLKDSVMPGGIFTTPKLKKTYNTIIYSYNKLDSQGDYSHSKLIASMDFGMWKYMFSPLQYQLTHQSLLGIFPYKMRSTPSCHINHTYFFNELDKVNTLRNRIAHHEPVCFYLQDPVIDTTHIMTEYQKIQTLFAWMGIDSQSMLYGLDHVQKVCDKINELK